MWQFASGLGRITQANWEMSVQGTVDAQVLGGGCCYWTLWSKYFFSVARCTEANVW